MRIVLQVVQMTFRLTWYFSERSNIYSNTEKWCSIFNHKNHGHKSHKSRTRRICHASISQVKPKPNPISVDFWPTSETDKIGGFCPIWECFKYVPPWPDSTVLTVPIIEPMICLIIFTKSSITSAFLNFLATEKFYKDLNKIGKIICENYLNNFNIFFSFVKRELFICDAEDIQREIVTQNQMRFHCKILYYKSLEEAVEKFDETEEDTFFYILGFNPQKRVIVCQERMQRFM